MVERFAVARGQPVEGNSGFIVGRLRAARAACDNFGLSYDSSSGNGPYGFGWSLSLPAVTRRTDKGLPRYQDAEESDIFILSGAEDLAPVLVQDGRGNWIEEPIPHRDCYAIKAYRPARKVSSPGSSVGPAWRMARHTGARSPETTYYRSTHIAMKALEADP